MSKRINLLEGSILSSLTRLALPIMATSLIQMAYNMTDMIWIGRVGSGAVAAVGAASMYTWLSGGLAILARMGGQVKVAHCLGGNDNKRAADYAKNAIQMGIFFSVIYGILMILLNQPLISIFALSDPLVVKDAEYYLIVTGGGILFSMMNQILTGLITATGNSKTPFAATTAGLLLNIILDPLLIYGWGPVPRLGVTGAAIATVTAQALVSLLFLLYTRKDSHLFCNVKLFSKPNGDCIREIVKIGLPSALQNMLFTCISMSIARVIASWGDTAIAVQKVGSQIESISWMTADGFAAAVNSFVAQNYGAGNFDRAKKGYFSSLSVISIWGVLSTLLLVFCAGPIFQVFIPEAAVLPMGVDYLVILGYSQLFMCVEIITTGAFAGFGKTLMPSIVSVILTAARIPMALLLASTSLGLNGVWWSISISSVLKGILLLILFARFLRKKKGFDHVKETA